MKKGKICLIQFILGIECLSHTETLRQTEGKREIERGLGNDVDVHAHSHSAHRVNTNNWLASC